MGAVVTGISLANSDLDSPEVMKTLYQAFLDFAILVFPGQTGLKTQEDRERFAGRFGPVDHYLKITNQKKDGTLAQGSFGTTHFSTDGWHTDVTFTPVSVKVGLLHAELVPNNGGETEFADMRAGYDCLDEATKRKIEDLSCWHSLDYHVARQSGFFPDQTKAGKPIQRAGASPTQQALHRNAYLRPMVKVHPETGRKSIFCHKDCFGVPSLSREEGTQLVDEIIAKACQAPRTYIHAWAPGDLVMWDERSTFHRSRPFNSADEVRLLWGVRCSGDPQTEAALPTSLEEGQKALSDELDWLRAHKPWEQRQGSSPRGGW